MSLIGNILNGSNLAAGITQNTSSYKAKKSLKSFLKQVNKYGIQTSNNYEVNFSGIPDLTFYIKSITTPAIFQNTTEIYYDGRKIDIPINFDYEHEFSMTVINDAKGILYTALHNFIMSDSTKAFLPSGYTITIRALTGDEKNYSGNYLTLNNVRIVNVGGLNFSHEGGDVQTFEVQCKLVDIDVQGGHEKVTKTAQLLDKINAFIK